MIIELERAGSGSRPASVTVRAVFGIPAEELLKEAADAGMIVVGSRGADGFKKFLLGSVTSQVIHLVATLNPVTLIPNGPIGRSATGAARVREDSTAPRPRGRGALTASRAGSARLSGRGACLVS